MAKIDGAALVNALLHSREVGEIGDAGAEAIAAAPAAEKLTTLSLRFAKIGPKGARALAASPHLAKLQSLDLSGNDVGDEGASAIAAGKWPSLRSLIFGRFTLGARGHDARNGITSRGAAAIARSRSLAHLSDLGLPIYEIDSQLAALLADSPLARFLYLSPGSLDTERASPDGKLSAKINATDEVWPDGPRMGTLEVSNGVKLEHASPSFLFSSDSKSLAAFQWNPKKQGRGALVTIAGKTVTPIKGDHGSLALFAFDGKTVRAFDFAQSARTDLSIDLGGASHARSH